MTVTTRAPRPRDTECVVAYRKVRDGVDTQEQLGYGRNLHPAPLALVRHAGRLSEDLWSNGRLIDYSTPLDLDDRALCADLLNTLLGTSTVSGEDVFFTSGSTEGISLSVEFLSQVGHDLVLPLPCYYAFPQSAARHGVSIAGYHDAAGRLFRTNPSGRPLAYVDIVPNGVTGESFARPDAGPAAFTVVDSVFQVGAHVEGEPPASIGRSLRASFERLDLTQGALLLTASKDLSIPAMRAGILVTKNAQMRQFLEADRFERTFCLNPLGAQMVMIYLAALVARGVSGGDRAAAHARLTEVFEAHSSRSLPDRSTFDAVLQHFDALSRLYRDGLEVVQGWQHDLGAVTTRPDLGYSLFARLPVSSRDPEEFTAWCNWVGREHGLKLNPAVMFGGTVDAWRHLAPDHSWVRVNLSVPTDSLARSLARLTRIVRSRPDATTTTTAEKGEVRA